MQQEQQEGSDQQSLEWQVANFHRIEEDVTNTVTQRIYEGFQLTVHEREGIICNIGSYLVIRKFFRFRKIEETDITPQTFQLMFEFKGRNTTLWLTFEEPTYARFLDEGDYYTFKFRGETWLSDEDSKIFSHKFRLNAPYIQNDDGSINHAIMRPYLDLVSQLCLHTTRWPLYNMQFCMLKVFFQRFDEKRTYTAPENCLFKNMTSDVLTEILKCLYKAHFA